jgi:hypothetical protein
MDLGSVEGAVEKLKQMMRNRQTAKFSRDCKKTCTKKLELQVNALQEENTKLRKRVLALEHENTRLRGHSARQAFSSEAQMSRIGAVSLSLGAFLAVYLIVSLLLTSAVQTPPQPCCALLNVHEAGGN